MITDEKMEKLIAELYEENICDEENSIDIDSLLEDAYREVEENKKKKAKEARRKKLLSASKVAAVFIGIIAVFLAVFEPEQGYADVFRFMKDRGTDGNEVISDNLIGDEAADEVAEYTVSLEELDDAAGFHVPMPEYVPEGYEMESNVTVVKKQNKTYDIVMHFINKEDWSMLLYNIIPADQRRTKSAVLDIPDKNCEEILIDDKLCTYYSDVENEKITLYWEKDEFIYSIDGKISRDEAVKTVESIE